ncbi:putative nucleolar single-stranded nucleic acid-binding protein [Scheffersomyces coipomensis]|uniref:putative nucleolar single-stranded nucleic acid-binding protein n=1 Tax=Scheffersomyces coipomensis TaxID=1788519 RepID=UPI00315D2039
MSTEESIKVVKPIIEDRIYVSNVDFKATEDELKELFEGLKVTEVQIPFKETKRGERTFKRHLGFAFVQFESKDEADKAIEEYNGKKFQRRNIFIKKAVPPPTEEEKKERIEIYKAKKEEKKKADKEKAEAAAATAKTATPAKERPVKKVKDSTTNGEEKVPEGKASTDTIFITNLDYKVNVKTLNNLFKDLKPKWIHVPTRKIPLHILKKGTNQRPFNKGIAFVKFSSEEVQKKAVEEFNGQEINGREIIVDIAIDARIPKDDEVVAANGGDAADAEEEEAPVVEEEEKKEEST